MTADQDDNGATPSCWTRRAAVASLIGAGLPLTGCTQSGYRVRYRLTARVRVQGQVHQASTVQEYRYRDNVSWLGSMDAVRSETFGDALVVVIGERLIVFTLKGWWTDRRTGERQSDGGPAWTLPGALPSGEDSLITGLGSGTIGRPLNITARDMPIIVTFDDPSDRRSARLLDPADLSGLFGPGAQVESLMATPTRERVTRGAIERYFPWAKESSSFGQARLDDAHIDLDPYELSFGDR